MMLVYRGLEFLAMGMIWNLSVFVLIFQSFSNLLMCVMARFVAMAQ